ncbi:MAG: hypothetical protein ACI4UV_02245 [Victivallales bacterium]
MRIWLTAVFTLLALALCAQDVKVEFPRYNIFQSDDLRNNFITGSCHLPDCDGTFHYWIADDMEHTLYLMQGVFISKNGKHIIPSFCLWSRTSSLMKNLIPSALITFDVPEVKYEKDFIEISTFVVCNGDPKVRKLLTRRRIIPHTPQVTAKLKAIISMTNLRQLILAVQMYAFDHKKQLPDSPDVLQKGNYLPYPAVYYSPVTETPYLYFGKGVVTEKIKTPTGYPVFVSPPNPVRPTALVAFLDGRIELIYLGTNYENVSQVFDYLHKNKGLDVDSYHRLKQSIAQQAVKP